MSRLNGIGKSLEPPCARPQRERKRKRGSDNDSDSEPRLGASKLPSSSSHILEAPSPTPCPLARPFNVSDLADICDKGTCYRGIDCITAPTICRGLPHLLYIHSMTQQLYDAESRSTEGSASTLTAAAGIEMFVSGLRSQTQRPKGPAKLYHKKSRNGCQRCRARRVKVQSTLPCPFLLCLHPFCNSPSCSHIIE